MPWRSHDRKAVSMYITSSFKLNIILHMYKEFKSKEWIESDEEQDNIPNAINEQPITGPSNAAAFSRSTCYTWLTKHADLI